MRQPNLEITGSEAPLLRTIAERVRNNGGRLLIVGGAVRDLLLGKEPEEFDLEVFGIPFSELANRIGEGIPLVAVGRSFPVLKVKGHPIDLAVPRKEWKTGRKHTDFGFEADPGLEFRAAALRRDFTINAIGLDPLDGRIEDPFGGKADLAERTLRHVSEKFAEDPLRVLRAMQFMARFNLRAAPETLDQCRRLDQADLAPERIFAEWKKLILKGETPSLGLFFLEEVGWLRFYPELQATVDCPQDPRWHPEGSVWKHTAFCMDAFARERTGDETEDLVVGLATLCHDLGKPATTIIGDNGSIRSPGHEKAGIEPTRTLLERMTRERFWFEAVEPLVATHMRPRQLYEHDSSPAAVRRLAERVGRLDRLLRLSRADSAGRPPLPPGDFPEGKWLLEKARALKVEKNKPNPIILGRDLLALGMEPGPAVGKLLGELFQDQLDGVFEDHKTGLELARSKIAATGRGDSLQSDRSADLKD